MATITSLIINGIPFTVPTTGSGQAAAVGGIPIVAGVLNKVEVTGFTVGANGFSGTATFSEAAVPEPAKWAMMVIGFGLIGAMMRRRPNVQYNFA
jgi:hypothetical protein